MCFFYVNLLLYAMVLSTVYFSKVAAAAAVLLSNIGSSATFLFK